MKKKKTIRQCLQETGLFLEGDERLPLDQPLNAYYGINVTKTDNEPIDQIQGLIFAKRIQEWNQDRFGETGKLIVFIGGLYEILNAQNSLELEEIVKKNLAKENSKKKLYENLLKKYDINGQVLITENLWQDQLYWEILKKLVDSQVMTRGLLMNDTLKFYNSKDQLMDTIRVKEIPKKIVNFPLEFIKKIGNWPAPLLYTPAEVTEALYLKERFGINTKIGQAQERVYDKYLRGNMNVFRIRQSVGLKSCQAKTITVTPYIDKEKKKEEGRVYFSETKKSLEEKFSQPISEEYVFVGDPRLGEVLNPIIEKTIFAVESARIQGKQALEEINCGQEIINAVLYGDISVKSLQEKLPGLIRKYILDLVS